MSIDNPKKINKNHPTRRAAEIPRRNLTQRRRESESAEMGVPKRNITARNGLAHDKPVVAIRIPAHELHRADVGEASMGSDPMDVRSDAQ